MTPEKIRKMGVRIKKYRKRLRIGAEAFNERNEYPEANKKRLPMEVVDEERREFCGRFGYLITYFSPNATLVSDGPIQPEKNPVRNNRCATALSQIPN